MTFDQVLSLLNIFNQTSFIAMAVSRNGTFKYTNHDGIIIYHTTEDNRHYRYFL